MFLRDKGGTMPTLWLPTFEKLEDEATGFVECVRKGAELWL
jgi:hypothetical protein